MSSSRATRCRACAVRGGWPASGTRPTDSAGSGHYLPRTVLVLPGQEEPVRYTVAAGDTLSGIGPRWPGRRGGWSAVRGRPAGHRSRSECYPSGCLPRALTNQSDTALKACMPTSKPDHRRARATWRPLLLTQRPARSCCWRLPWAVRARLPRRAGRRRSGDSTSSVLRLGPAVHLPAASSAEPGAKSGSIVTADCSRLNSSMTRPRRQLCLSSHGGGRGTGPRATRVSFSH